jgi:hypothetical protein
LLLRAVKLAPLNIKNGQVPFSLYKKNFPGKNSPLEVLLWIGKYAKTVKMTVYGALK